MDIPTPPAPFNHSNDLRMQYLSEWKTLFSTIHPDIKVVHYYEENFKEVLLNNENSFNRERFDMDIHGRARIIIFLPIELELSYVIGLNYDKMFSEREVTLDTLYQDENYPCVPNLYSWKKMYKELCVLTEKLKKQIPSPPL